MSTAAKPASRQRDLRLRQLICVLGIAEHAHRLLGTRNLGAPAGAVHVALAELLIDLRSGNALRLERGRIQDHPDGAVDATHALHGGDARQAQQALGDRVVDVPAELLQRHVRGLRADVGDRLALGVDPRDLRLDDAFRQCAADLRNHVSHVVDRAVGRRALLETHEGRAVAFDHRAIDFIHAVDAANRRLDALRHLRFHLVGRGAGL